MTILRGVMRRADSHSGRNAFVEGVLNMEVNDIISLELGDVVTLREVVSKINNSISEFPERRYAHLIDEEGSHYDIKRIK